MQLKTTEAMGQVLAPKTYGTLAVAAACEDMALDFLVLCSSLTSVVGEFGQSDYAAANAFMDAYAHWRSNEQGRFTVAINWDSWQQVGMAVHTEIPPELRSIHEQIMQGGLTPSEGVEVFRRVLSQGTTAQVVVSTKDLPLRIERIHALTRRMLEDAQAQTQARAGEGHARPALTTAYVAPRNAYEQQVATIWQQVLGVAEVGVHDSFFDLGGHSLLITQLLNKLHRIYAVEIAIGSLFDNPTVEGMAQVIAAAYLQKAENPERPIRELVRDASPSERQSLLEAYWKRKITKLLKIAVDALPANGSLEGYDIQAIIGDIQWNFEQDFDLQVYPHEIVRLHTISDIAHLTKAELDRLARLKQNRITAPISLFDDYEPRSQLERRVQRPLLITPERKNAPIVFSHSSVRSGSTLFRVMLAGHPALYSPPELGILWYDSMRDWRLGLTDPNHGHGFFWAAQGLQWTFMELLGRDPDNTRTFLDDLVERDVPIYDVYAQLQQLAAPRMLVDKSPSYTMSLETLQRAEQFFAGAKHIHLIRHPYAVIESIMRIRLDKLFSTIIYGSDDVDPFVVAEKIWVTSNRNMLTFLQQVETNRQLRVYYEDLVSRPEEIMREVCEFIEVPYDPAVIQPYDNKRERMISGIGDPNILKHERVDEKLGETWRKVKLPYRLGTTAQQLAAELGYELPSETDPVDMSVPELPDFATADEDMLARLIDQVQHLSVEEAQAMIEEMEKRLE